MGVSFSEVERASYDSVAFRYIAANQRPDHDTLASFRRRFLPQIEALFVSVLELAGQMGLLKLGRVALYLTQAGNDKQPVTPMLKRLKALPAELARVTQLLADTGYCSQDNVEAARQAEIEPLIALGREAHNQPWQERFIEPPSPEGELGALDTMGYRLKTREDRALYALRKQTVEPVFGIVKSVMGFRQFMLRGVDKTRGEWSLVTLSWNIKRMFALQRA